MTIPVPRETGRSGMNQPESGVLRACLDLLAAENIFHRRWNSGSAKVDNGDGTVRLVRFGSKGDADILAIPTIDGRPQPVWIETKSSTGRQSFYQKIFQQDVEERGHTYLIVRDAAELQAWLRGHRTCVHRRQGSQDMKHYANAEETSGSDLTS